MASPEGRGPPLVGRAAEIRRVDATIRSGGALVVVADAGLGKSALLEAAVAGSDRRVVRAQGRETESHLPFAILATIVEPFRDGIAALHPARGAALSAALALGPPTAADRFAVCQAVADLLAQAAAAQPTTVVVDDLHWSDRESAECIAFLSRRCPPGLAVLLAARPTGGDQPWHDLPTLTLEPLPDDAARTLLRRTAPDLPPTVLEQLVGAAAGNPLALTELPGTLVPDERAGRRQLARPLSPGPGLGAVFGRRITELPETTRHVLLVAALGGPDAAVVSRACADLGLDQHAFEPAERAGLIAIASGDISFRHPLVRGAALDAATADERRRAHTALAAAKGADGGAWHLGEAAIAPDETVAAALEASAGGAQRRGGHAAAATALERSARLSPQREDRLRRLAAAGGEAFAAGLPAHASSLLGEAADAGDAVVRATASHLGGLAALWSGQVTGVAARIAEAGELLVRLRAPHAPQVFADAAMAALVAGDCRSVVRLAQRGTELLRPEAAAEVRAHLLAILSWGLVLRGERRRALPLLSEVDRLLPQVELMSPTGLTIAWAINCRLATEEYERARRDMLGLAERARTNGVLSAVPAGLAFAAEAERRLGERTAARTHAEEAWALGMELGQVGPATQAGITLLELAAEEGRAEEARAGVERWLVANEATGAESVSFFARAIQGRLDLGLGDAEAAATALGPLPQLADRLGLREPTMCANDPDLVEALWRCERHHDAVVAARRLCAQTDRSGGALALALGARARGIVAPSEHETHFLAAIAWHAHSPDSFQHARTRLAFGMRLRRDRRRAGAREQLRIAHEIFARLGAAPWEAQAADELRLAGGRRRATADPSALTPREVQVARLVAGGATNREVARELVLSPRTVEHHLATIYRKLGVRGRAQLARSVADGITGSEALDPNESASEGQTRPRLRS